MFPGEDATGLNKSLGWNGGKIIRLEQDRVQPFPLTGEDVRQKAAVWDKHAH